MDWIWCHSRLMAWSYGANQTSIHPFLFSISFSYSPPRPYLELLPSTLALALDALVISFLFSSQIFTFPLLSSIRSQPPRSRQTDSGIVYPNKKKRICLSASERKIDEPYHLNDSGYHPPNCLLLHSTEISILRAPRKQKQLHCSKIAIVRRL